MRVSAIIPTFGRATSLKELLAALRAQTVPLHEIIVVDQNAHGWLRSELGHALDGVQVLRAEAPNASTARNVGAAASSGELLLFIDDDLLPEPGFTAALHARFSVDQGMGCLCPVVVSEHTPRESMMRWLRAKRRGVHARDPALWRVTDTISAVMCFRKEAFLASGGFDELLFSFARAGEDQELCWRMGRRGQQVWIDTALHIHHDEGVPGGCELRRQEYWDVRRRILNTLTLCARLQNRGRIGGRDGLRLVRSAFLNSMMLRRPPTWVWSNGRLLAAALVETKRYLDQKGVLVEDVTATDYMRPHLVARQAAAPQSELDLCD